ncbi:helix-turn-helix transcriptional regulator [Nocardia amamiensis]|uniref:helix-turn-helix transcriptional regulator n=1 Tax=Nocardia amamiensis TaxID=404578 RepID=UPI00082AE0CF|nr:helix-turn-helix transcriptional regulator [Nocardia amamiensis]
MRTTHETLTHGQGFGAISGYLLKLLREAADLTQSRLAELLRVDTTTVSGWESGRRSLASVRAGDLARLRALLTRHGAPPDAVALLTAAMDADLVVGDILAATDSHDLAAHPLALGVHQRSLASLITWPINGIAPPSLAGLAARRGRGPRPNAPQMSAELRREFFDRLRATADRAHRPADILLRRQATYLLGFDQHPDSETWITGQALRRLHTSPHDAAPARLAVRSAAITLASHGDPDLLRHYVSQLADDHSQQLTNLLYWAYWVGEIGNVTYPDDTTMVGIDPHSWTGRTLLLHLTRRIEPGTDHIDLYIRTLADLISSHPHLLDEPVLRTRTMAAVDLIDGDPALTIPARRTLDNVGYAVRLRR